MQPVVSPVLNLRLNQPHVRFIHRSLRGTPFLSESDSLMTLNGVKMLRQDARWEVKSKFFGALLPLKTVAQDLVVASLHSGIFFSTIVYFDIHSI